MDKHDLKEFAKLLLNVGEIYKEEISKNKLDLYYNCLEQLTLQQIQNAFNTHIKSSKFFPKPSEILEIINPTPNLNLNAEEAWLKLREAIRSHGYYQSVQFDDPIIHSVIRSMGGWPKVSDREQDTWMHKDFIDSYKILSKKDSHPEKIPGILESQNAIYSCGKIDNFIKKPVLLP